MNAASSQSVATIFSNFVADNSSFLNKQAYRMSNNILEHEDCLQELYLRTLTVLEKDPSYGTIPKNEQQTSLRSVLMNFTADKIRASVVRNDTVNKTNLESTSVSSTSESEDEEGSLNTFDHYLSSPSPEMEVSTKMFTETAISYLEKYEETHPGIVEFFQELLDPSPEIGEKYEAYKATQARPRVNGYIPMSVLGKLMGYEEKFYWRFEVKIKEVMKNVFGLDKNSVVLS